MGWARRRKGFAYFLLLIVVCLKAIVNDLLESIAPCDWHSGAELGVGLHLWVDFEH